MAGPMSGHAEDRQRDLASMNLIAGIHLHEGEKVVVGKVGQQAEKYRHGWRDVAAAILYGRNLLDADAKRLGCLLLRPAKVLAKFVELLAGHRINPNG